MFERLPIPGIDYCRSTEASIGNLSIYNHYANERHVLETGYVSSLILATLLTWFGVMF